MARSGTGRRGSTALVVVLLAAVVGALALAGPAQAEPVIGELKNKATGLCLDSNNEGQVYTGSCNGGNFQQWNYKKSWREEAPYWDFKLVNRATGRCLDSNANGDVYTLPCQAWNSYQSWDGPWLNGSETPIVNQKTKRYLDSNASGNVYTNPLTSNNKYQQWIYCVCS